MFNGAWLHLFFFSCYWRLRQVNEWRRYNFTAPPHHYPNQWALIECLGVQSGLPYLWWQQHIQPHTPTVYVPLTPSITSHNKHKHSYVAQRTCMCSPLWRLPVVSNLSFITNVCLAGISTRVTSSITRREPQRAEHWKNVNGILWDDQHPSYCPLALRLTIRLLQLSVSA